MRVGYLGRKGSNTESAALDAYGENLYGYGTVPAVFRAVANGEVERGVVPVENSVEGSVGITYDLLFRTDLSIVSEHYRKITHCLIARPGSRISDIQTVISHPQAAGQCTEFIESHGLNVIPFPDTATSVKALSGNQYEGCAAIGNGRAASIYGMEVLASDIGDFSENFTRFVSVAHTVPDENTRERGMKMSVVFSARDRPGSLLEILEIYSRNGMNLTRIESRPVKSDPWNYIFFIDSEYSREKRSVVGELRDSTGTFRVLGIYPAAGASKTG